MKTWTVQSKSNPEATHQVSMITPYHWECSCESYKYRKSCSHIKAIQQKYDKQNKGSQQNIQRTPEKEIQSNDRRLRDEGDSLPKQELRRDNLDNGEQTPIQEGDNTREGRTNLPEQLPKTSVGKPDSSPDMPRPSETDTKTEDKRDARPSLREKLLEERERQIKRKEAWETRITQHSKTSHAKLAQLKAKYKATKSRSDREIIVLQARAMKLGIKAANRLSKEKYPHPDNLIETDIEKLTEEECQQYKMYIALD